MIREYGIIIESQVLSSALPGIKTNNDLNIFLGSISGVVERFRSPMSIGSSRCWLKERGFTSPILSLQPSDQIITTNPKKAIDLKLIVQTRFLNKTINGIVLISSSVTTPLICSIRSIFPGDIIVVAPRDLTTCNPAVSNAPVLYLDCIGPEFVETPEDAIVPVFRRVQSTTTIMRNSCLKKKKCFFARSMSASVSRVRFLETVDVFPCFSVGDEGEEHSEFDDQESCLNYDDCNGVHKYHHAEGSLLSNCGRAVRSCPSAESYFPSAKCDSTSLNNEHVSQQMIEDTTFDDSILCCLKDDSIGKQAQTEENYTNNNNDSIVITPFNPPARHSLKNTFQQNRSDEKITTAITASTVASSHKSSLSSSSTIDSPVIFSASPSVFASALFSINPFNHNYNDSNKGTNTISNSSNSISLPHIPETNATDAVDSESLYASSTRSNNNNSNDYTASLRATELENSTKAVKQSFVDSMIRFFKF